MPKFLGHSKLKFEKWVIRVLDLEMETYFGEPYKLYDFSLATQFISILSSISV